MTRHLFTYGSLMFPPVWRRVVGGAYPTETATLPGYAIFRVKGEPYPGIVPVTGSVGVPGVVYRDLDPGAIERLDRFEGDAYERLPVCVVLASGHLLTCDAYVFTPSSFHVLSPDPWTAEDFRKKGLQEFLAGYEGFDHIATVA